MCQEQVTSTPRKIQLERSGFQKHFRKRFQVYSTSSKKHLKPAFNVAAAFIGMAVGAKTKNRTFKREKGVEYEIQISL